MARSIVCIGHDSSTYCMTSYPLTSISCSKKLGRKACCSLFPSEGIQTKSKSFSSLGVVNKVHVFSLEKYSFPLEQSWQKLYSAESGQNADKEANGTHVLFTFCRFDSHTTLSAMVLILFLKAEKKDILVI